MRPPQNKYLALAWLMRNERMSRDKIAALQNKSLKRLVSHAYNTVPLYRKLYADAGVHPDEIRSTRDLHRLPTIDKQDINQLPKADRLSQKSPAGDALVSIQTSGSSGIALEFYIDRAYDAFRKAQYLRPYLTNDRRLTDRVLNFGLQSDATKKWFQKLGLLDEISIYANSMVEEHIAKINSVKPQVIQGYGSELNLISQAIIGGNVSIPRVRRVFTDSELLPPGFRETIERAFETRVIDVYGSYEVGNVGYECERRSGYHLAEDCVVTEFLDPEGHAVSAGEEGELTFTSLHNLTMPFIRYRSGDAATFGAESCKCGRNFPLMTSVVGRMTDFIVLENQRLRSPTGLFHGFDAISDRLLEYQVTQTSVDVFDVRIIPRGGFDPALGDAIRSIFTSELPNAQVNVSRVESIPRLDSGKYKAFVQRSEYLSR